MTKQTEPEITIAPARSDQKGEALRLAFADLPAEEAALQIGAIEAAVEQGSLTLEGLFVAEQLNTEQEGRMLGALWAHIIPGRTAVIHPPQRCKGGASHVESRLVEGVIDWLKKEGIVLAQTMLPIGIDPPEAMRAQGFSFASDLLFMVSYLELNPNKEEELCPIELIPYSPAEHTRLEQLVEATYENTLDCPRLEGVREMGDVLEGYRATGKGGSRLWSIIQKDNEDIGCLLLADHPDDDQVEIVYMGIIPSARGSSLGLAITEQAQKIASDLGRARLVLAVDASNAPAIAAYKGARFQPWDHRRAWLLQLE